eukprot:5041179-Pleurochrysis_carterae.AAC.6
MHATVDLFAAAHAHRAAPQLDGRATCAQRDWLASAAHLLTPHRLVSFKSSMKRGVRQTSGNSQATSDSNHIVCPKRLPSSLHPATLKRKTRANCSTHSTADACAAQALGSEMPMQGWVQHSRTCQIYVIEFRMCGRVPA